MNADPQLIEGGAPPETRPMYWSVRRELWENRSIYIAPLAGAGMVLFAFFFSAFFLPRRMRELAGLDPLKQHEAIVMPYSAVAGLLVMTAFVVGVFYCLDALYGERRDRSILFWKSLPVSDRTTVLAKASIPLIVLPTIIFTIIVTTQLIMFALNTIVLLGHGPSVALLWSRVPLIQMTVALFLSLIAIALWHAPIYCWLLFVSVWSRRAAILWAVLPLVAIMAFERIAFNRKHFAMLIGDRVAGWYPRMFDFKTPGGDPNHPLTLLTPGRFLSAPGLWIGLAFAAALLLAAIRLRRGREPV